MTMAVDFKEGLDIAKLVIQAVETGTEIITAMVNEAKRPGATHETVIRVAQDVIDRKRVIDSDVDAVAAGKV